LHPGFLVDGKIDTNDYNVGTTYWLIIQAIFNPRTIRTWSSNFATWDFRQFLQDVTKRQALNPLDRGSARVALTINCGKNTEHTHNANNKLRDNTADQTDILLVVSS